MTIVNMVGGGGAPQLGHGLLQVSNIRADSVRSIPVLTLSCSAPYDRSSTFKVGFLDEKCIGSDQVERNMFWIPSFNGSNIGMEDYSSILEVGGDVEDTMQDNYRHTITTVNTIRWGFAPGTRDTDRTYSFPATNGDTLSGQWAMATLPAGSASYSSNGHGLVYRMNDAGTSIQLYDLEFEYDDGWVMLSEIPSGVVLSWTTGSSCDIALIPIKVVWNRQT